MTMINYYNRIVICDPCAIYQIKGAQLFKRKKIACVFFKQYSPVRGQQSRDGRCNR